MSSFMSEILRTAKELGFTCTRTKNGHLKFKGYGEIYYASSSPSDIHVLRKVKNSLAKIKDGGHLSKNISHHKKEE